MQKDATLAVFQTGALPSYISTFTYSRTLLFAFLGLHVHIMRFCPVYIIVNWVVTDMIFKFQFWNPFWIREGICSKNVPMPFQIKRQMYVPLSTRITFKTFFLQSLIIFSDWAAPLIAILNLDGKGDISSEKVVDSSQWECLAVSFLGVLNVPVFYRKEGHFVFVSAFQELGRTEKIKRMEAMLNLISSEGETFKDNITLNCKFISRYSLSLFSSSFPLSNIQGSVSHQ